MICSCCTERVPDCTIVHTGTTGIAGDGLVLVELQVIAVNIAIQNVEAAPQRIASLCHTISRFCHVADKNRVINGSCSLTATRIATPPPDALPPTFV